MIFLILCHFFSEKREARKIEIEAAEAAFKASLDPDSDLAYQIAYFERLDECCSANHGIGM